jgi:hypothetical protein
MRVNSSILWIAGLGCAPAEGVRVDSGVAEVEWGSWELNTHFVTESETCSDMGASGENLGTLYGEIDINETNELTMTLGDQFLSGSLNPDGFFIEGFRPIEVTGDDSVYGIGVDLEGWSSDPLQFSGILVYRLDFPNGLCEMEFNIDAGWLYYEPPPFCDG